MHAVGAHIDVFADNLPSLENRVLFKLPATKHGSGRGGFGTRWFTWALLDWGNYRRVRRAVWTHPANQELDHSPEWYRRRGQHPNCSDSIWSQFYAANPNFEIPAACNSTRAQLDPDLPANQRPCCLPHCNN